MTKSEIFKKAWDIAKKAAARFGGSSKSYFSEALKQAHRENKEMTNFSEYTIKERMEFLTMVMGREIGRESAIESLKSEQSFCLMQNNLMSLEYDIKRPCDFAGRI